MGKIYSIYDLKVGEITNQVRMYLSLVLDVSVAKVHVQSIDLSSEREVFEDENETSIPMYFYQVHYFIDGHDDIELCGIGINGENGEIVTFCRLKEKNHEINEANDVNETDANRFWDIIADWQNDNGYENIRTILRKDEMIATLEIVDLIEWAYKMGRNEMINDIMNDAA